MKKIMGSSKSSIFVIPAFEAVSEVGFCHCEESFDFAQDKLQRRSNLHKLLISGDRHVALRAPRDDTMTSETASKAGIQFFRGLILFFLVFLIGCADLSAKKFDSLLNNAPYVVSVSPMAGQAFSTKDKISIEFSESILPESVGSSSLAIVKSGSSNSSAQDSDIVKSIIAGKTFGVEGKYDFSADGRIIKFTPQNKLEVSSYLMVITNKVISTDLLPLKDFAKDSEAFVSEFYVAGSSAGNGGSTGNAGEGSSGNTNTTGTGSATGDATSTVSDTGNGSEDGGDASANEGDTSADKGSDGSSDTQTTSIVRPKNVIINEVLYDVIGDDTNGQVFIELLADAKSYLDSYKILLINGNDGKVYHTIEFPQNTRVPDDGIFVIADDKTGAPGTTFVANADFIDNFDPQNGPDCIVVVNDISELLDALGYGNPIKTPAETGYSCYKGTPAAKAATGSSLTRTNGQDTSNNQSDFKASKIPTPGVL